jgi:hypothetical protein
MSDCSKDESSWAAPGSHNRRPRNEKIKAIAIKSAEKDEEIRHLREANRQLEFDNAIFAI